LPKGLPGRTVGGASQLAGWPRPVARPSAAASSSTCGLLARRGRDTRAAPPTAHPLPPPPPPSPLLSLPIDFNSQGKVCGAVGAAADDPALCTEYRWGTPVPYTGTDPCPADPSVPESQARPPGHRRSCLARASTSDNSAEGARFTPGVVETLCRVYSTVFARTLRRLLLTGGLGARFRYNCSLWSGPDSE